MIFRPKNHLLRFSLRGLFLVVTLVAVWLGWSVNVVRQRKGALAELQAKPGVSVWTEDQLMAYHKNSPYGAYVPRVRLSKFRELLGDQAVEEIVLLPILTSTSEREALADLFPEARVHWGLVLQEGPH